MEPITRIYNVTLEQHHNALFKDFRKLRVLSLYEESAKSLQKELSGGGWKVVDVFEEQEAEEMEF